MSGRRLSVRDYKGPRREGVSATWLGPFAVGLVLGLLVAAAVFVETRHHFLGDEAAAQARRAGNGQADASDSARTAPAARGDAGAHTGADADAGNAARAGGGTASGASSATTERNAQGAAANASAGAALPKYDFYQMLPRSQVLVPQRESEAHLPAGAPVERPGTYFLQIGSYRDAAVADRVRQQVQKLGVTASVQRIVVNAATWHRVRVGPIRDLAMLNRVRQKLQAGNLQAMIVRVNP